VKKTLIDALEEKALQNLRKDGMWTSFNNVANDKERGWNSDIFQTFTGQLHYQTACAATDCKYVSHRFETFRSLDLDIPVKDNITLEDCLTNAIHTSQLDSDNCYECDKCKRKTRAIRKMNIWRLPSVLVICLKRFKTDYRNQQVHISKNTSNINIPPMLDMNPYLTLNLKWNLADYELFAIANHIGTPNGGHCFSYLKTPENKWFLVNDAHIEALPRDCSFNGTEPYILFYRQK
jgi:ubiquitin C-terminal hydrolase